MGASNGHYQALTAEKLQAFMESHHERDYLLIDVRQPAEYEQFHIPGATLMPLPDFESRLFDLPSDKDLIFYCKVGSRSQMAAMLAQEGDVTEKSLYHLFGGIHAWNGKTLADFPKVRVFETSGGFTELLLTAMDMERGAERFYQHVRDRYSDFAFSTTFDHLARVETAHARIIHDVYRKTIGGASPESFDALYERLAGDILEGGESLEQMTARLDSGFAGVETDPCISLMELALNIEYAAYDLYRGAATREGAETETAGLFLDIAQAEKSHMRILAKAIANCESPGAGKGG